MVVMVVGSVKGVEGEEVSSLMIMRLMNGTGGNKWCQHKD